MKAEKIYIVIPVYNVEKYIERCIDSLLNQTYQGFEIILIDDGSTDDSPIICDNYSEKYNHIITLHKENGGQSEARNMGIEYVMDHADIDRSWITFVDSDDFVHPLYLEFLVRAVIETDTDISSCSYIRKSGSDIEEINETDYYCELVTPEGLWCKDRVNALLINAKLYRLNCFIDVRYPVGKIREDEFITHTILFQKNHVAVVWLPLYYYAYNDNSTMSGGWHPGHLAALDAFEEQIHYFKQHGFDRAYKTSYETLCEHSIKTVRYIKELSPKYDEYLNRVIRRRDRALKGYGKEFGILNALRLRWEYGVKEPIEKDRNGQPLWKYLMRKTKKKLIHSSLGKKYLQHKLKD